MLVGRNQAAEIISIDNIRVSNISAVNPWSLCEIYSQADQILRYERHNELLLCSNMTRTIAISLEWWAIVVRVGDKLIVYQRHDVSLQVGKSSSALLKSSVFATAIKMLMLR